eukprot:TRINITY_DN15949_c0_g1_i1.p1 TRINITY_DN15949_c0_g1~~TRINITY_DN15949_c0_g1_i1.p1  ORF type:complete len:216 (-),score=58.44 TRINITY_DN15949_c0_g1_i1:57-704(-)
MILSIVIIIQSLHSGINHDENYISNYNAAPQSFTPSYTFFSTLAQPAPPPSSSSSSSSFLVSPSSSLLFPVADLPSSSSTTATATSSSSSSSSSGWYASPTSSGAVVRYGPVGINIQDPTEALCVGGNILVTGNVLKPSDARIKRNIVLNNNTNNALKNILVRIFVCITMIVLISHRHVVVAVMMTMTMLSFVTYPRGVFLPKRSVTSSPPPCAS